MRGDGGLGVMGGAGSAHSSFVVVGESQLRSSSIEDGVGDGIGAASAQSSPVVVEWSVRSRSIVEGVGDGGGAASAHIDPVLSGLGVVVCALRSSVELVDVVGIVGVLVDDEVGGGGVTVAVVVMGVVVDGI